MRLHKILAASTLAAAITAASMQVTVSASDFFGSEESVLDGPNLEITANYDTSIEMPLSLEASSSVFYCNANLSPGDVAKSSVAMKNISKEPISVSIIEIENMLPDDPKANLLLDVLELTIDVDGEAFYQGKHSELAAPFMPYVEIAPGKEVNLNISMSFPREADNRYQGAKYKMRWVFDAVAEEPPAPEEPVVTEPAPVPKPPEPAKTGVEAAADAKAIPALLLVGAAGVACLVIAKGKKKYY